MEVAASISVCVTDGVSWCKCKIIGKSTAQKDGATGGNGSATEFELVTYPFDHTEFQPRCATDPGREMTLWNRWFVWLLPPHALGFVHHASR